MTESFLFLCLVVMLVTNCMILWCLLQIVRDMARITDSVNTIYKWIGSENYFTAAEVRGLKEMFKREVA